MTTTVQTASGAQFQPHAPSAAFLGRLAYRTKVAALKAWHAYKAYRALQTAKAHLMSLDKHTLKDIGIDRSEIASILLDHAQERRRGMRSPLAPTF